MRRDALQTLQVLASVLQPTDLRPSEAAVDNPAQQVLESNTSASGALIARKRQMVQVRLLNLQGHKVHSMVGQ